MQICNYHKHHRTDGHRNFPRCASDKEKMSTRAEPPAAPSFHSPPFPYPSFPTHFQCHTLPFPFPIPLLCQLRPLPNHSLITRLLTRRLTPPAGGRSGYGYAAIWRGRSGHAATVPQPPAYGAIGPPKHPAPATGPPVPASQPSDYVFHQPRSRAGSTIAGQVSGSRLCPPPPPYPACSLDDSSRLRPRPRPKDTEHPSMAPLPPGPGRPPQPHDPGCFRLPPPPAPSADSAAPLPSGCLPGRLLSSPLIELKPAQTCVCLNPSSRRGENKTEKLNHDMRFASHTYLNFHVAGRSNPAEGKWCQR